MHGVSTDGTGLMTRSSARLRCSLLFANIILRYPTSHCSINSQAGAGSLLGSTDHFSYRLLHVLWLFPRLSRPSLVPPPKKLGVVLRHSVAANPGVVAVLHYYLKSGAKKGFCIHPSLLPMSKTPYLVDTLLGPLLVGYSVTKQ